MSNIIVFFPWWPPPYANFVDGVKWELDAIYEYTHSNMPISMSKILISLDQV